MATLEDIAKRLNTTKGTVSKALNGAPDVSEGMRQAVLETAVEMNYSRALRRNNDAPCLCILVQYMLYAREGDFGYDIILGFRKQAEANGYRVEVVELNMEIQELYTYDEFMLKHNYRGALILGMSLQAPWLRQLTDWYTPAVLFDNCAMGNPKVAHLGVDSREAMELVVNHLADLGHKRIGYLSGGLNSFVFQQRYDRFVECAKKIDPDWDENRAGFHYHTMQCVQENIPKLLTQGVTAIVCSHDMLAIAAITHLSDLGIKVPEDVSIVGFDNMPISAVSTPPLTTVCQDREKLGNCAFPILCALMDDISVGSVLLHANLVIRDSTAKARENALDYLSAAVSATAVEFVLETSIATEKEKAFT